MPSRRVCATLLFVAVIIPRAERLAAQPPEKLGREARRAWVVSQPRTFDNQVLFARRGHDVVRAGLYLESTGLFGDFDGDDDIDQHDYVAMQICASFSGPGVASPTACRAFDSDGDTDVDLIDSAAFLSAYTGTLRGVLVEAGELVPIAATPGPYYSGEPGTWGNNALNGIARQAGYTQDDLWYEWAVQSQLETTLGRSVTRTQPLKGSPLDDPTAVIAAAPLAGDPPLLVNFDARSSVEPNGFPLTFSWNFGDGSQGSGPLVQHTYSQLGKFTAVLRATNPVNGRFGEAQVDIVTNNDSPTAVIRATPTSGQAPLEVDFSAAESNDLESPASQLTYQWNFGDGTSANGDRVPGTIFQSTTHTYRNRANGTPCTIVNPCEFTAVLTVTDEGGKQDTDSVLIRVGNTDPVPVITNSALQGSSPFTVVFNAKNSTDGEGQPLTVEWSWGDGTSNETYPALTGKPPATDGSVPHTFTLPVGTASRTYRVTATVRDNAGGETQWAGVTVAVTEPEAGASDPRAIFTLNPDPPILNQTFTADGTLSFDRPVGVGQITAYAWVWGDGTANDSGSVATHTYTRTGTFVLTLTVTDDEGNNNSLSRDILILILTPTSGAVIISNRSLPATAYTLLAPVPVGTYIFSLEVTNLVTLELGTDTVTLNVLECLVDDHCDDGLFCNGVGVCVP